MTYFSEWCELKQGELESMLNSIANMTYEHNHVNKNIAEAAVFVKIIGKLFRTLSRLEFIGKHKERERRLIIKEEKEDAGNEFPKSSNRPRFLG